MDSSGQFSECREPPEKYIVLHGIENEDEEEIETDRKSRSDTGYESSPEGAIDKIEELVELREVVKKHEEKFDEVIEKYETQGKKCKDLENKLREEIEENKKIKKVEEELKNLKSKYKEREKEIESNEEEIKILANKWNEKIVKEIGSTAVKVTVGTFSGLLPLVNYLIDKVSEKREEIEEKEKEMEELKKKSSELLNKSFIGVAPFE